MAVPITPIASLMHHSPRLAPAHTTSCQVRCARDALDMSTSPALEPGDLAATFEGIVSRFPQVGSLWISN
jgi:hypothetical protein